MVNSVMAKLSNHLKVEIKSRFFEKFGAKNQSLMVIFVYQLPIDFTHTIIFQKLGKNFMLKK